MKERTGLPQLQCSSLSAKPEGTSKPQLPEGLVGPPSVISVKVNGSPCSALLDSGSQITIIFEGWYQKYLGHLPLYPVEGLAIWGLSNSSYPYRGYIVVEIEFSKEAIGTRQQITVMALVCPDVKSQEHVPVIIGTNASLFGRLGQLCEEAVGPNYIETLSIHPLCYRAFCQQKQPKRTEKTDEHRGSAMWAGPGPLKISPGAECDVQCHASLAVRTKSEILVIEPATGGTLPGGLLVQRGVLPACSLSADSVSIRVKNESRKEVILPRGTVVAQIYKADTVTVPRRQDRNAQGIDPALFNFGNSPIPEVAKDRLRRKMAERANVFSTHEWDVGLAKEVEHHIRLNDPRPFRERSRRLAPADIEDIRNHLQELLHAGIISESRSPYASPIVVARKKNGSVRMCIDYRTLNKRTVPDQYTLPRIDDALDSLSGSKWFSVLDLRSGYYQIAMREDDKEKTAFICPLGFYQFERMPQGITGAPATFQRLMERAVGDMNLLQVLVYLDDLIVFGRTLEEHEARLLKVLDRLEEYGLKLSLDKCQFCQTSVKYVGHIVSEQGIATDPDKVEAVANWEKPTDLKSLRSFLGFCGYYRRFVKNYSAIVKPLTDLTKGYPPALKEKRATKSNQEYQYFKVSEPFGSRWDDQCDVAFQDIIHCLINAPVLAFADSAKPYTLHVDASFDGLGAVLYQEHPEGLRPVAFASRKLSNTEKRYPVHQLEFLALKWAVVDKFHDYLYGARFLVCTDNNPLTYVLTSAKLNATGHRWLASLATYNFSLQYRPGKSNIDADALSRRTHERDRAQEWLEVPAAGVKVFCQQVGTGEQADGSAGRIADQLGLAPEVIPEAYACPLSLEMSGLHQWNKAEIQAAQRNDPVLGVVWRAIQDKLSQEDVKSKHPDVLLILREWSRLVMEEGLLYRATKTVSRQLILPQQYREMLLKSLHDEMGHLGVDRTLDLVKSRFYWPRAAKDVEQYIKNCRRCIQRKTLPKKAAPLQHITSRGPLDLVCIDFLAVEPDSRNVANILVVTDHYTRYAQAFPTRDQKAVTVARVLWEQYFVHYGLPARIHSDQGRDFESRLVKELLKVMGIKKSRTTPYHPQGDPQPERFNRTLLNMLGTLDPGQKSRWSQHVNHLVHAYNCTRNDATGYSPYFLMFGREPRLPVDLCFGVSPNKEAEVSHLKYVLKLREELQEAYKLAANASGKQEEGNKRRYDRLVRAQALAEGDRVLLRNFGLTGKNKLADRWRSDPYVVVSQLPDLPVYRVKLEKGRGGVKTIHRNHLLPIGWMVRMPGDPVPAPTTTRRTTRTQENLGINRTEKEGMVMELESDDEDEGWGTEQQRTPPCLGEFWFPERIYVPSEETGTDGEGFMDGAPEQQEEVSSLPPEEQDSGEELEPEELNPGVELEPELEGPREPRRSQRKVKPVRRLTYDVPGKSCDVPLSIVHRGVVIHVAPGEHLDSSEALHCATVWSHPVDRCSCIARVALTPSPYQPVIDKTGAL